MMAEDAAWTEALVQTYQGIASTRMAGMPFLHAGLQVAAVGFRRVEAQNEHGGQALLGILLTPWFMNLVWRPLGNGGPALGVGQKAVHRIGQQPLTFIGAHEPALGPYESCSMISPVLELPDQATAVATAEHILMHLLPTEQEATPSPSRRAFLLGRRDTLASP